MTTALDRILAETGQPGLVDTLASLSGTDLQTLLLAAYARRAETRTPADLLRDYGKSRFFGAAAFPREAYARFEQAADAATAGRFETLALSPLTPFATCAAVATVGQDWSIPTARSGEVVSDPTNVLAIEAALRRRTPGAGPVHLATTHRVVRPQAFANPKALAHFALFALVSAGRDTGSHATEAEAIGRHLDTHLTLARTLLGPEAALTASCTIVTQSTADARLLAFTEAAARHGVPVEDEPRDAVDRYYAGFCFHLWRTRPDGTRQQLADGGTVDWVARLSGNRKERAVISGAGVEGMLTATG